MLILTIWSNAEPADSSMCAMLLNVCRICAAIGPRLRPPVAGSTGPIPERKMYSPTRTPGECGRFALRETLSFGLRGSITLRESRPLIALCQRYAFDLDLASAAQLGAADRAGRRVDRKELAIDLVHVVVLQHRVDQHVGLDHLLQGGACRLEHLRHGGEYLPCLRRHGAVHSFAGGRIDSDQAGHEDERARSDRRRERQVQVPGHTERRIFRCNNVSLQTHRSFSRALYAAAMTSSMTLKPASICTLMTVRAG